MDKTQLVEQVKQLFEISGHKVTTSIKINHREIDVVAEELNGLVRKTILIECADYQNPVGIPKLQDDFNKLRSAKETLKDSAVIMHVSRNGYSPDGSGYALNNGVDCYSIEDLTHRLINFTPMIDAIASDKQRNVLLKEYQPTKLHFENSTHKASRPALEFVQNWLQLDSRWLTVLGDYGVGKSWMLKRCLYHLIDAYKQNPVEHPLPFFVPLQQFRKAFDFKNLILGTFDYYGLSGIHYPAFEYLMSRGRILFLFDSFDEMAQSLGKEVLRENLNELLSGLRGNSKAIMTSRPTYFEGRAERITVIERDGRLNWHKQDNDFQERQTALGRSLSEQLGSTQFARLNDLTDTQRQRLFDIVLEGKDAAKHKLLDLYKRFKSLGNISQRAVIARLLTTVAETLASGEETKTPDGYDLLPDDLVTLNQAKIFEIVIHNLLHRDAGFGSLSAIERLTFLRAFALYLQNPAHNLFATPNELRSLVEVVFRQKFDRSDTPQQLLDNYYRTCRRHSGLTTEGQFLDTSGNIDAPVDETDTDSRVGFSHNSLREYLVADAICEYLLRGHDLKGLTEATVTETIGKFIADLVQYRPEVIPELQRIYASSTDNSQHDLCFKVIYWLTATDKSYKRLFGDPIQIDDTDLSDLSFSDLDLSYSNIMGCLIGDTDFRRANLRESIFSGSILERTMFDDAQLNGADFVKADVQSIYVFDGYDKKTTVILQGKEARQWLFSRGALVENMGELNPLLGQDWYEAAREVMKTLEREMAGTRKLNGLYKGIKDKYRLFAKEFSEFLLGASILEKVKRSEDNDTWLVKVDDNYRHIISNFSQDGKISNELFPFFERFLKERQKTLEKRLAALNDGKT